MKKVKVYKKDGTAIEVFEYEVAGLKKAGKITDKPAKKEQKTTGYSKEDKTTKSTK